MAGPADERAERIRHLAALWRQVTSRPLHPAGCTCMGHFLIPAADPKDMEADILDYMRGRYAAEGLADLVALLDAREADRTLDDGIPRPFRAWLTDLPRRVADPAVLDRFVSDLTATLDSFETDRTAASGWSTEIRF